MFSGTILRGEKARVAHLQVFRHEPYNIKVGRLLLRHDSVPTPGALRTLRGHGSRGGSTTSSPAERAAQLQEPGQQDAAHACKLSSTVTSLHASHGLHTNPESILICLASTRMSCASF